MVVLFVVVEKLKFDYEKLKNKSVWGKFKTSFANIQKSLYNNTNEVMQETLMNGYYFSFFKKLKKEVQRGEHENLINVEIIKNTLKKLEIKLIMKKLNHESNGLKMLEWCLDDIKLGDAFSKSGKEKKLKKLEKKMTDNFIKGVQKNNKGRRFSINSVKKWFKGVWNNHINKSISDVRLKCSLNVYIKK